MIFSSETCNLPYHCGQQIRQKPIRVFENACSYPTLGGKEKGLFLWIWKNKKIGTIWKKKILSNLKVTVLEQVNQGLHPGKVWENRIFLYFIGIVDIRKPILRFHWDQHRKRRKSRCRVLEHPDLIEHINVAHECDWFLVKLLRTPTSRFVGSGPCSNLIVLPCRSATYLRICRYSRTPLPSWHGKLEPSLRE